MDEKLGKLLRSMQPEMPKGKRDYPQSRINAICINIYKPLISFSLSLSITFVIDMMLLNERAMQAMLDDANEIDYEFSDDETAKQQKSQNLVRKQDSNSHTDNTIRGMDFSLAIPPPGELDLRLKSNSISPHLKKLAKQLESVVSV